MRNLVLLLALLYSCAAPESTDQQAAVKPNVLILFVDDLGWTDLGVFGSDLYQTPAIDQLAADGVRFTNAYSACTVCSPSRAAMMTGMYPGRTNVTDFITGGVRPHAKLRIPDWNMKLDHEYTSLAEAMKAGGYKTAHVGKWHLMPRDQPEMMNGYLPQRHGFDINIGGNEWGAPGSYFHPYGGERRKIGELPPGGAEGDYLPERLTGEALKIIENWKDESFFMYFAYYNVHTPIMAKEDEIARFEPLVKPGMRHTNPKYAAMVAAVDQSVARLRAKLDELAIADKTVIIFASDNGGLDRKANPTENKPLREGKGSAYEGGVRTPAIIHAPGITPAGAVCDEPIITVDYYPTVLALAGVEGDARHNENLDGVNLEPILRNPQETLDREALYWHYPHYHSGGATPHSAIRSGDYRLVEFFEDNHVELYNLSEDIGETKDLVSEESSKARELTEKLHAWRAKVAAQLPTPNPDYDPSKNR